MQPSALHLALPLVSLTGSATFASPRLHKLASNFGPAIAWRAACFENGIGAAAAGASGAFSVGLSDGLGRTSLAVDRFAIHSLCYREVNGELRFAPRADVLADSRTEIDPQAIFDYLFFHTIPSPRTIYKGIYRLPPAHCAEYENGVLNVAPYWTPTFEKPSSTPFADLREEFLQLLRQAVGDQLDGSKAACFLSGGQRTACGQLLHRF
jgi:asparagine synthase (glutamine-hydrolysing)